MTIRFITHNIASRGLRNIRSLVLEHDITNYSYDNAHNNTTAAVARLENDLFINWGRSTNLRLRAGFTPNENNIINKPSAVAVAVNKLRFFESVAIWNRSVTDLSEFISIPAFTTNHDEAVRWYATDTIVVGRNNLTGHSGDGITLHDIAQVGSPVPYANTPLFVKYIKKRKEYRVHVFQNTILDIQEKRRTLVVTLRDNTTEALRVRSHHNGWVYCRENLDIVGQDRLERQAKLAIKACGLDFGAVDIIWNERENMYYVLEVNTAVGAEGKTAQVYADAFATLYNNR